MFTKNIEPFLNPQFWDSPETVLFGADHLDISRIKLPLGSILFQTSGSSGGKKWVVHTRESLLFSADCVNSHLAVSPADSWFLSLPIQHVGGFGVLARAFKSGCKIVNFTERWNAVGAVKAIRQEKVTIISFVPTQLVDIVRAKITAPESVRAVIVGGGKLDPQIKQGALGLKWPVLESYGMTETGSQIATQLSTEDTGLRLIKGWQVRGTGNTCLQVKGRGLLNAYIKQKGPNVHLENPLDEDGWFTTSDIVDIDSDTGALFFQSRNDRVVKILGELVNLEALESKLSHLLGREIIIIEILDERRGHKLIPMVEKHALLVEEFDQIKASGLYQLEQPQVCEHFPRNSMGKLDRFKLRESVVFSKD